MLPSGMEGTTMPAAARAQSVSVSVSSYRNEKPMSETKAMMPFSTRLYELVSSRKAQSKVEMAAPIMSGSPKSIWRAMAAPRISASEVETEAAMALSSTGRLRPRGR